MYAGRQVDCYMVVRFGCFPNTQSTG